MLDLAVAPLRPQRQGCDHAAAPLTPRLAAAAEGFALCRGWLPDALFAGAFLVAAERMLGIGRLDFTEAHPEGLRRVGVEIDGARTASEWLAAFEALRRDARAAEGEPDFVWVPGGPATRAQGAPLQVGADTLQTPAFNARFDPLVFDPVTVRALLDAAARVLEGFLAWPERPLFLLDVLGDAQRGMLLDSWNRPSMRGGAPFTVDELFAMRAAAMPSAPAVVADGAIASYAQLERLSNAVAHRLLEAGVGTGEPVGVAMPRGIDCIAILLGLLKVGAAYLPIDSKYPAQRIAFMLADARASRVIAGGGERERLPGEARWIDAAALVADGDGTPVARRHDAQTPAYVMYTSGSTGEPKGIAIPHRGIVRLVHQCDFMRLAPEEAVLHAAPLGFDASTLEIWGPLLNGGRCVVHSEAVPTAGGLSRTIREQGVTSAWLTAALFNTVVDEDPRHLRGLRQLLIGGEALSVPHVLRALDALPELTLINGYGPTECTTFTATYAIPRDVPADQRAIPIGRPISGTCVYVLNARLEPVPVGIPGELCVGGRGLALGYLNRPALDAERFVENPFVPGEKLYRTGDIVRYLPDGIIDFVGRRDNQIKMRGYRIELGEIESALGQHPAVGGCAVVAHAARAGTRLVAYIVPRSGAFDPSDLRRHLLGRMPEFMVPASYVRLAALPLTTNGKLDRRALPPPGRERPELAQAFEAPLGALERQLCETFAEVLELDRVGRRDNFFDLGGSSLGVLRAIAAFETRHGRSIPSTCFFSDPTPAAIAAALEPAREPRTDWRWKARGHDSTTQGAIAIIAVEGRFPGAAGVEAFWDNLRTGRDTITHFTDAELDPAIPASLRADGSYVPARGVIEGVEQFDAEFFGISPREAELMDPQQRIFLELCWACIERGGYVPESAQGPIGVFAGMYNATYFQQHVAAHPDKVSALGEFQVMLANEKDYIATRTANRLDLTGPAVSIHTACSTSLVAIAQAVDSLRAARCDMALAGGVSVRCPPRSGYLYQEGAMLSPDGRTRTFDAAAQGTVFSDGAAVVLLKRLEDALADGDPVIAVIRGAAVNNDGGAKASFTAPSVDGQAGVIAAALADARISPRQIEYVEAHGTATPLGDPVEIEALTRAFRGGTQDRQFCRIGSLKSNMGHLVIAAGAAGVIKAALALEREELPASLYFETPNDKLGLAASPFVVNTQLTPWPRRETPRYAGVSSFGVGGTNAHIVLEEPPLRPPSEPPQGPQMLQLSARSEAALSAAMQRLAGHLESHPGENLADVAHTLRHGRRAFAHRACVVAATPADAAAALRLQSGDFTVRGRIDTGGARIAFMFPGQAAQYAGMGSALYESEPVFRAAFDECLTALQGTIDFDLAALVFSGDAQALKQTAATQPALFCIEYALARWWQASGAQPSVLLGHSVGEFVAATIGGVFRVEDAVRLVARRGQLMQALPEGAMLAVRAGAEQVAGRLVGAVSVAAENSPALCVIAGPADDIERTRVRLESDGIVSRPLHTSHAFHSSMMDPAIAPFEEALADVELSSPAIPIVSTVHGRTLHDSEARNPAYWARHLRETVRFSSALRTAAEATGAMFLEVGPRATLTTLARQHTGVRATASLGEVCAAEPAMLRLAAGRLWTAGFALDLEHLDRRSRKRRVALPSYPFERRRHWLDAAAATAAVPMTTPEASMNSVPAPASAVAADRKPALLARLRGMLEDISGIDMAEADACAPLIELGFDSLALTQVALQLKQTFKVGVTFRMLVEKHRTLDALATLLDAQMPPEALPQVAAAAQPPAMPTAVPHAVASAAAALPPLAQAPGAPRSLVEQVIAQQMQLMAQQLALLQGQGASVAAPSVAPTPPASAVASALAIAPAATPAPAQAAADTAAPARYDVKKAFGAIARIHTDSTEITARQRARLDAFMRRYIDRTRRSKEYTAQHRAHLADPRVVNGFRPMLKEIIYQIVVTRSKGAHVWDLDGNQYVDVLNGFGMNLFGWSPDFINEAVRQQLEAGYEIGPQHPFAGDVAKLVCKLTGFERAALCNTGSEAVMGCVRIARTVTGRSTIAMFAGSYHGIFDEVIVRAAKGLRAVPAAPGIMPNTSQNVLVLDYGTPESMAIIKERAGELAAVLVEPVQSRRPDFQPREFLNELRAVTRQNGALLILDEVVTGFRSHPGGIQALFDVRADLCSYGKVAGGGFPIGIIAGQREYMDALDGGGWEYGDDSMPTVGVTYFAGTFVRHPLALAAAKVVLERLDREGPGLQAALTNTTTQMVEELNDYCGKVGAPIVLKSFASVWKIFFTEDHPLQDLLFGMMRSRGVHILDNFPCFFTTAHDASDISLIKAAFRESVAELQEGGFIPRRQEQRATLLDANRPPVPGARLGKDPEGRPAWYLPHPERPGEYVKVEA